ncbi:MAG: SDR family oxidoreductase [Methylophilaceae bacterium]|jgi:short-subunit dehydrogenase|nr:MAG: SDR family oxidoreductase [Methylophilaceae bacterium]
MKTIFITGASSGIGLALARQYAIRYANDRLVLGLVGRQLSALQAIAKELESVHHTTCTIYALDVRDSNALNSAAKDFMLQYGAPHVVIASAGVSRGTLTEYEADITAFQAIIDINLMGMVHTFSPFITAMQNSKARQTQLVGIASVAGIRGLPGAGAYSASKAAVITYLESLRVEMQKYGINVTTIAPGYIRTPMTSINTYKMPFLMEADCFAKQCIAAIAHKRRFIVIPWQMGWLAKLLRFIPPVVWDWLMRNAPHKERTDWDWL